MSFEDLSCFFRENPRFAVAFSGGVDSSFLLAAAVEAGCDVKAYGVKTAFQYPCEIQDATRLAEELQVPFQLIELDIFAHADICENGPDRCYRCKRLMFSTIKDRMRQDGFTLLADATNADDDPARRPGFVALKEYGVVSPLRAAGLGKEAIRAASRQRGLFTAEKPSRSCLAVRAPEGATLHPALIDELALSVSEVSP